jgi:5-methylcytosine-specific restriction endonuclease McrA
MDGRVCPACSILKSFDEFHKNSKSKNGLASLCKPCAKTRASAWYKNNKERATKSRKSYWSLNATRLNKIHREWVAENKDLARKTEKAWRTRNSDRKRANDNRWHAANPEKVRRYRVVSEARRRGAPGAGFTAADVDDLYKMQKGRCAACRVSLRRGYHVDHINALARGGRNEKTNIQLLCAPCNRRKHTKSPEEFMRELGSLL